MNTSESTIASYLQDASVLEGSLRRTLIAHIAVSARDEHRSLLEDHLRVTIAQERRINERLTELGGGQNPVQTVIGAAKGAGALVLTLAKGPADALRGPTGDDVTLRNAQDECASEQLEIAVYTAIEALATELGDEKTAELARKHRAQEEDFLGRLSETVPGLARNVAQARQGNRKFGLPTIGALDAARALVTGAQTALRPGGSDDKSDKSDDKPTNGGSTGSSTSGNGGTSATTTARTGGPSSIPTAPSTTTPKGRASGKFDIAAVPDPGRAASKPRPTAPAKQAGAPMPPAAKATTAAPRKAKPAAKPAKPKLAPVPPSAKDVPEPEINKTKPKRETPAASAATPSKPKAKPAPKPGAAAKPAAAAATTPGKPAAATTPPAAAKTSADTTTTPSSAPATGTTTTASATSATPASTAKSDEPKPVITPTTPPIGQYDDMTPYEIGEMLDHMPEDKLDAIEWYEKSHENREQVLEAVAKQRQANAAKG